MIDLVPLFLLLAMSRKCSPATSSPAWPSAAAPPPPPPLPPMPSADPPSDTSAAPGDVQQKLDKFVKARNELYKTTADKVKNAARDLFSPKVKPKAKPASSPRMRARASSSSARATSSTSSPAFLNYAPPNYRVSVADVQKVLIRRGYSGIKKDGLYGPKTELAWKTLANGKGLSPAIARVGPKIATVNQETFTTLSIP